MYSWIVRMKCNKSMSTDIDMEFGGNPPMIQLMADLTADSDAPWSSQYSAYSFM